MKPADQQLKSMGAVATSTAASGVLGLLSNALIAANFGRGIATDAFFMAQSSLRVFAKFFQTGPLGQIVMPIFLEARRGDVSRANRYASNILTVTLVICGAFSLVLWLVAPWVVGIIAPGFTGDQRILTTALTRLFVPVIFCTILINLLTTLMRAFHHFGFAEWVARLPVVLLITVLVWGAGRWNIDSLVWALIAGSLVQVGLLWIGTRRIGVPYRPVFDRYQPEFRTTWQRLTPFFLSSAASQMQLIVHRMVASGQPVGTLSAFTYADRMVDFMIGFLGVIPMVLFPQFIQEVLAGDRAQFRRRLERVVVLTSLVAFPVAVALIVFSKPVVGLLFQRGRFDALATQETALALSWLAVGLFAWNVWGLCKTVAYAVQRPLIVNRMVIGTAMGVSLLSLTIGRWWGLAGLAITWAVIPYLMATGYLWQLRCEVPGIHRVVWNSQFFRVVAASLGMGLMCWALRETVWIPWLARLGSWSQAIGVGGLVLSGMAGYWLLLGALRVEARHEMASLARRSLGLSRQMPVTPVTPQREHAVPVGLS